MKYEIQTEHQGMWIAANVGTHGNEFDTREEAEAAIEDLRKLGGEWADAEYRIVEVE